MGTRRTLLGAALLWPLASRASTGEPLAGRFDPRRDAAADMVEALTRAAAEGKNVIVDVGGEWCAWCHILDRFIAANADLRSLIDASFVWVKVNYSPENRNERLLSRWPKVEGYPHLFVLDGQGRVLRSQPSAQLEGGRTYDKAKLLRFLQDSRSTA
jgi:thiol:disulfide interchange protein